MQGLENFHLSTRYNQVYTIEFSVHHYDDGPDRVYLDGIMSTVLGLRSHGKHPLGGPNAYVVGTR